MTTVTEHRGMVVVSHLNMQCQTYFRKPRHGQMSLSGSAVQRFSVSVQRTALGFLISAFEIDAGYHSSPGNNTLSDIHICTYVLLTIMHDRRKHFVKPCYSHPCKI